MKYAVLAGTTAAVTVGVWFSTDVAGWSYLLLLVGCALVLAGALGHVDDAPYALQFHITGTAVLALLVGVQSPHIPLSVLGALLVLFTGLAVRGEL